MVKTFVLGLLIANTTLKNKVENIARLTLIAQAISKYFSQY